MLDTFRISGRNQEEREVLILKSKLGTFIFVLLLNLETWVLPFEIVEILILTRYFRIPPFRCLQEERKLLTILKSKLDTFHVLFNAEERVLSIIL